MPQRIETITQHVFAFDDDEIARIINALHEFGDHELAEAIFDELPDAEPEGGYDRLEEIQSRRSKCGSRPSREFLDDFLKDDIGVPSGACDFIKSQMGYAVKDGK